MDVIKNLWSVIEADAKFMRRLNGWFTVFWIIMIPVAFLMGWLESVTFVSALSLWALVSGHWAAWQAARVEVEQQREEHRDTDGRIARRIIKETNLTASRSKSGNRRTIKKKTVKRTTR